MYNFYAFYFIHELCFLQQDEHDMHNNKWVVEFKIKVRERPTQYPYIE